jgi:hypothetical protein
MDFNTSDALKADDPFEFVSSWWFILAVISAILGIALLEFVLKRNRRHINPPCPELCELFPAYQRRDAPGWKRWKLYPGAMFLMIPRFIALIVVFFTFTLLTKIWLLCHDKQKPITGCRKFLINITDSIMCRLLGLVFFTWQRNVYLSHDVIDYTDYLGTNEP